MILNDQQIREQLAGCITPFTPDKVRVSDGVPSMSYGTGGHGYDLRLGYHARELSPEYMISHGRIDPKRMLSSDFVDCLPEEEDGEIYYSLRPGQLFLGVALEYIVMPLHLMGVVVGKSTYARAGLVVNATPIEAGWRGYLTLELANTTNMPIKVYAGEGIAQVLFFAGDDTTAPYDGKYQDQGDKPVVGVV